MFSLIIKYLERDKKFSPIYRLSIPVVIDRLQRIGKGYMKYKVRFPADFNSRCLGMYKTDHYGMHDKLAFDKIASRSSHQWLDHLNNSRFITPKAGPDIDISISTNNLFQATRVIEYYDRGFFQ